MEQGIWTREFLISPELCGMDGRLGVLGGLTLFQALAAEHAEQIGVGFAAMARRREFWLTVHCRIELRKPLALMDSVTGETKTTLPPLPSSTPTAALSEPTGAAALVPSPVPVAET